MTDERTDQDVPQSYTVSGWATLGPSYQLRLGEDESLEDISSEEHREGLRETLRSRGFPDDLIDQMHIEIDQIVEN